MTDKNTFHIVGRTADLPDPYRDYNWIVEIEAPPFMDVKDWDTDLTIKAKSASVPGKGVASIETTFMGMKQYFPGSPNISGSVSITFYEFEDFKVSKALNKWLDALYDTEDITKGHAHSKVSRKNKYSSSVRLKLLRQNAQKEDEFVRSVVLKNVWLESVNEINLTYGAGSAVECSATFRYDYYVNDFKEIGE